MTTVTAEEFLKSQRIAPSFFGFNDPSFFAAITVAALVVGFAIGYFVGRRIGYRVAAKMKMIVDEFIEQQRQLVVADMHRASKKVGEEIGRGLLALGAKDSTQKLAEFERALEEFLRKKK